MARHSAPLLSWLHLSDIHFGQGGASERERRSLVLAQLLAAIRQAEQWGAPCPDTVFVTGDIGFSGDVLGREEYTQAANWLERLAAQLGLEPRDIHLVPGNHDVARASKDAPTTLQLLSELRQATQEVDGALINESHRKLLVARLKNYIQFSKQFSPPPEDSTQHEDRLFWHRGLRLGSGLRLRLLGLNTALLADEGDAPGLLRLGLRQLRLTLQDLEDDELVIALGHHPPSWLGDGPEVSRWLEAKADILLTGHLHDQQSLLTQRGGGRRFVHVAAGATYDSPPQEDSSWRLAFNFGAIVRGPQGRLRLQLWPFTWTRQYEFRPDQEHLRDPKTRFLVHELERLAPPAAAGPRSKQWRAPRPLPPRVDPPLPPAATPPPAAAPATPGRYRPVLALYVVWHPKFEAGLQYATRLYSAFTRNAKQPLAPGLGVPVFFHSQGAAGSTLPPPIALESAEHSAVVVLVDGNMLRHAHEGWSRYVSALWRATERGTNTHRVFPVSLTKAALQVDPQLAEDNFIRLDNLADEQMRMGLLASRLTNELCRLLLYQPRIAEAPSPEQSVPPVKLFLSHTKLPSDPGVDIARQLRNYVHENSPLQTFFDEFDIPSGERFAEFIEGQFHASGGLRQPLALVAIQTDGYGSREWCQREVLVAKRLGLPIVVVHAVARGEERSFPYLGNVPTYRWNESEPPDTRCQAVMDLALAEVLRREYLTRHLERLGHYRGTLPAAQPLARSPELLTLLSGAELYIYPDPPLGQVELELLRYGNPKAKLLTPLQMAAQAALAGGRK